MRPSSVQNSYIFAGIDSTRLESIAPEVKSNLPPVSLAKAAAAKNRPSSVDRSPTGLRGVSQNASSLNRSADAANESSQDEPSQAVTKEER